MAAFEAAVAASAPIELDVQLLADDKLAIFHDANLRRMTGKAGRTCDQTSGSIKELRLWDTDHRVPFLDDVLDTVKEAVPILVDIKSTRMAARVEPLLFKTLRASRCTYAVESFNPFSLRWFKLNAPDVIRGQLSGDFRDAQAPFHQKFLLSRYYLNFLSDPDFIAYDIRCLPSPSVERERRRRQIPLLAWTIRTEAELARAGELADNTIFEGVRP